MIVDGPEDCKGQDGCEISKLNGSMEVDFSCNALAPNVSGSRMLKAEDPTAMLKLNAELLGPGQGEYESSEHLHSAYLYYQFKQEDASGLKQNDHSVASCGGNGDPFNYDMTGLESNQDLHVDNYHQSSGDASKTGISFLPIGSSPMITTQGSEDLFHLLGLSRCSSSSNVHRSTILDHSSQLMPQQPGLETPSSVSSVIYDPVYSLSHLPPQPPDVRALFQSLSVPPPYSPGSRCGIGGSVVERCMLGDIGDDEQRDGMMRCLLQEGIDSGNVPDNFDGEGFEGGMDGVVKGRRGGRKVTKHFIDERERRVTMNVSFDILRSLVPNPTKADKASTVADAIDYIKELLRTVKDLELLVERKRRRYRKGGRIKRQKAERDGKETETSGVRDSTAIEEQDDHASVRTSWVQRKSKDTDVDVRVVDDEVTIKLVWRKKANCHLLFISKALDELQLELHHVAGGHIGDHCCFLFNSKIYEGSSVYASAIACKLITVVDGQHAATPKSVDCY